MELGAFSVSLTVKDLAASQAFYEKLGFSFKGGEPEQGWVVLKNGNTLIGLFQGMFDKNILTFNPGWDQDAQTLTKFTDVRNIEAQLQSNGVVLARKTGNSSGPDYIVLEDPDGNQIMIDQHV